MQAKNKEKNVAGFPLYSREEYEKQQKASKEPYDFGDGGYDDWYKGQLRIKKYLEKRGVPTAYVGVVVSEMEGWFREKSLENNSKNVARYVAEKLRKHQLGKQGTETNGKSMGKRQS